MCLFKLQCTNTEIMIKKAIIEMPQTVRYFRPRHK
jgi:hypothetical protein